MGIIADKIVFNGAYRSDKQPHSLEKKEGIQWLKNEDTGYSIPYIHVEAKNPKAIILYSHGNAENIYTIQQYIETLSIDLEADIICWDYAGYGPHKSVANHVYPSEKNVYSDVSCIMKTIVQSTDLPIVVWGRSLGTAPSIHACVRYEEHVHRLIVESGFRSCVRVVQPAWLAASIHSIFDMFDNEEEISKLERVPILIVHGCKDQVIPFNHSQYLMDACQSAAATECLWIKEGTHNNIDSSYRDELYKKVLPFLYK